MTGATLEAANGEIWRGRGRYPLEVATAAARDGEPGDALSGGFPVPHANGGGGKDVFVFPRGASLSHPRVRGVTPRARIARRACRLGGGAFLGGDGGGPGGDGDRTSPRSTSTRGRDGAESVTARRHHRRGAPTHRRDVRSLDGTPLDGDARDSSSEARERRPERAHQRGGNQGDARGDGGTASARGGDANPDRVQGPQDATMVQGPQDAT